MAGRGGYGRYYIPPGGTGTPGQLGVGDPGTRSVGSTYIGSASSGSGYSNALLGASAFGTMFGSLLGAQSATQNAKAIAAAARYNAALAELEANRNAELIRRDNRRQTSSEYVQMAAKSGVLAEQGGWLDRVMYNFQEREMAAIDDEYRGRNAAALERYRARSAIRQGKRSSAAAIIGGVSRVASTSLSLYAGGGY